MLVTFKTKRYANITIFGDVATRLLTLMGHSGTVPGAIKADDVPAALARLRAGIEEHGDEVTSPPPRDDEDRQPTVHLAQRAQPLIELLESAVSNEDDVMWAS